MTASRRNGPSGPLCPSGPGAEFGPVKRSVRIDGRGTTLRLERMFWDMLDVIAAEAGVTPAQLLAALSRRRAALGAPNLASCCRVVCLKFCQGKLRAADIIGGGGAPPAPRRRRSG